MTTETTTEIPWDIFCEGYASAPSRYLDIEKPFVWQGYRYATDSRIAVRVAAPSEFESLEEGRRIPKSIVNIGWHLAEGATWEPWPERASATVERECPRCKGRGTVGYSHHCSVCGGGGAIIEECPHCGQDMDEEKCERCDGKGEFFHRECDYCGGKGDGELLDKQPIGAANISGDYDDRIRRLPGPIEFVPPKDAGSPILFRFSGGEGVVMPLSPDKL